MSLGTDLTRSPWYAVQTQANREGRAATELGKQGFETFLPRYMREARHFRRVTKVAAPLFPGYLFVRVGALAGRQRHNRQHPPRHGAPRRSRRVSVEGLMARRDPEGYLHLPPRWRRGQQPRAGRPR